MPGVGKTTVANAVYSILKSQSLSPVSREDFDRAYLDLSCSKKLLIFLKGIWSLLRNIRMLCLYIAETKPVKETSIRRYISFWIRRERYLYLKRNLGQESILIMDQNLVQLCWSLFVFSNSFSHKLVNCLASILDTDCNLMYLKVSNDENYRRLSSRSSGTSRFDLMSKDDIKSQIYSRQEFTNYIHDVFRNNGYSVSVLDASDSAEMVGNKVVGLIFGDSYAGSNKC